MAVRHRTRVLETHAEQGGNAYSGERYRNRAGPVRVRCRVLVGLRRNGPDAGLCAPVRAPRRVSVTGPLRVPVAVRLGVPVRIPGCVCVEFPLGVPVEPSFRTSVGPAHGQSAAGRSAPGRSSPGRSSSRRSPFGWSPSRPAFRPPPAVGSP